MSRRLMIALCVALATAGCEQAGLPGRTEAPEAPAEPEASAATLTGDGVWDGRPSLGGVWVARNGVEAPARVEIVDERTGASVTGALFRRTDAGAAAFQVSSDAAVALDIPAETAVPLTVTILDGQTSGATATANE